VKISFKFLTRCAKWIRWKWKYTSISGLYFRVQRTNMAENKRRNSRKGLFSFELRRDVSLNSRLQYFKTRVVKGKGLHKIFNLLCINVNW
jgi:hypothetical protein